MLHTPTSPDSSEDVGLALGITTEGFQSLDVYPLANSVDTRATAGIDLLATFLDRSTTDLVAEPDSCISLFNIVKYSRPIKVKYNYIPQTHDE